MRFGSISTEPFWQETVRASALTTNPWGKPRKFKIATKAESSHVQCDCLVHSRASNQEERINYAYDDKFGGEYK